MRLADTGVGMVQLTPRALDIAIDSKETSAEWQKAVCDAALSPPIHRKLWDRYQAELPGDDELRRYLIRELKFNDNTVDQFIAEYKETVDFSGLAKLDGGEKNSGAPPATEVKIGDYVQWTNSGVDQLPAPLPVTGFSEDGEWAFLENRGTAVPVSELEVKEPPKAPGVKAPPPANPSYTPPPPKNDYVAFGVPAKDTKKIPVTLPTLRVAYLEVPYPLDEAEYKTLVNSLTLFKDALTKPSDQ